jgi:hypothetical protein
VLWLEWLESLFGEEEGCSIFDFMMTVMHHIFTSRELSLEAWVTDGNLEGYSRYQL